MNKLKFWKLQYLWEKYFKDKDSTEWREAIPDRSFGQRLKEKILENYPQGVSQYHNDFFLVEKFSFEKSFRPVFVDEYKDNRSGEGFNEYFGLKKQQLFFQKLFVREIPVYLIDNHNKALYSFLEVSEALGQKINIVHIDAHRDNGVFTGKYLDEINWDNIKGAIGDTIVSNYLDLADKSSTINRIKNITQSFEFEMFIGRENKRHPYVLNLDIDIFGPEGSAVSDGIKMKAIAKAWKGAAAVVIAMSPGFIKREDAESLISFMTRNLQ